jgi:hypothetical protein
VCQGEQVIHNHLQCKELAAAMLKELWGFNGRNG